MTTEGSGVQPYFRDEQAGITIWHGDARDVLPLLPEASVDLILTDPPYGQEWQGQMRTGRMFEVMAGDDGNLPLHDILRLALRTLRRARHLYVFGLDGWGNLPIGGRTELIWDKGIIGLGDLALPWGPQHERILFGVYECSKVNREDGAGRLAARLRRGSVLREPRLQSGQVNRHPTEKPLGILRQMIESSSCLGETVLDMFCGSGSTLEAALIEGRGAIGIDVSEEFCEQAARRVARLPLEVAGCQSA